jgi:hypothetical protein
VQVWMVNPYIESAGLVKFYEPLHSNLFYLLLCDL